MAKGELKSRRLRSRSTRKRAARGKTLKIVNGTTVRVSQGLIVELADNRDFAAAIRTGRALNALLFAIDLVKTPAGKEPKEQRNGHRRVLVLGGYTYETLLLLQALAADYASELFFTSSSALLRDRSEWKVAEKFRNRSAFHLDSEDKFTSQTLSTLKAKNYDLYSAGNLGLEMTLGEYYFNLCDEIDVEYFSKELKGQSTLSPQQLERSIATKLGELARTLRLPPSTFTEVCFAKPASSSSLPSPTKTPSERRFQEVGALQRVILSLYYAPRKNKHYR